MAFRTLFGGLATPPGKKPEEKARVGIAIFHDALPIPGSNKWKIHNDVMTVHHTHYYRGEDSPPADWDSPTPIPFPSVQGHFLIAILAPNAPEWAESAMGILKLALAESGVGGKTSSGYGRFQFEPPPDYHRGMVKSFGLGPHQSFGHIIPREGGADVFVHRNGLRKGIDDLKPGDIVDYRIAKGTQNPQAEDVHFP
jgi:CRISPR-associated protein Cmr6